MQGKLILVDHREDGKYDFILEDETGSIIAVNGCKSLPDYVLNGVGSTFDLSLKSLEAPNLVLE